MARILLGGGTGSIGNELVTLLRNAGHQVFILSRTPDNANNIYYWNPIQGDIDTEVLNDIDIVINLAGAGIADKRWTTAYKKIIVESRTKGNELLYKHILGGRLTPKQYISASAIGIYGDRGDELLHENSPLGSTGFLPESCKAWENSLAPIQKAAIPTTILRLGIVLFQGGALGKMLPSYNFGLGTYFGDGKQWYSWVHINDAVRAILHCINHRLEGIYNLVAPNPVSNKDFAKSISDTKGGAHIIAPVPAFALKLGMGEMAAIVLDSTRVSSKKIQDTDFNFQYPELMGALKDLIG